MTLPAQTPLHAAVEIQIGQMIRMLRLIRGLSQQDLARQLNVSFQQVQKYEKATTHIAGSRLYDIARILNAPIAIFFQGLERNETPQIVIHEIVERYKEISPQFGLHEFMELNRAYVGISDRRIRAAVLKLVRETADVLGSAAPAQHRKEGQGFRPAFRRGSGHDKTEERSGGGSENPDKRSSDPTVALEGKKATRHADGETT